MSVVSQYWSILCLLDNTVFVPNTVLLCYLELVVGDLNRPLEGSLRELYFVTLTKFL